MVYTCRKQRQRDESSILLVEGSGNKNRLRPGTGATGAAKGLKRVDTPKIDAISPKTALIADI